MTLPGVLHLTVCQRLGYDDYIIAAIELYLDLVNLFLFILRILGSRR